MELWKAYLILCPAAAIGGAINAVAGGGTLISFPALMFVLGNLPGASIIANATNTVALCPGAFSGAWGYRREIKQLKQWIGWLAVPSLLGGLAGSLIVVEGSEKSFRAMVPWLIGLATLLFMFQPKLTAITAKLNTAKFNTAKFNTAKFNTAKLDTAKLDTAEPLTNDVSADGVTAGPGRNSRWMVFIFQLVIGIYGGYFGAGIGILMLSSLSLLGIGNIHHLNGLKTILAGLINGISIVVFVGDSKINWQLAVPMMVSAILGGWLGATWSRKLDKKVVRRVVITIGVTLTVWYFGQSWLASGTKSPESQGKVVRTDPSRSEWV